MKERKLDIFQAMRAADQNDGSWLSKQPDDAKKEFAPLVAMRWAATVSDGPAATYMLWMINDRVNQQLFELQHHPDLVWRLIASCGIGVTQKHHYIQGAGRKSSGDLATKLLQEHYPHASEAEIMLLLSLFDHASFKQFVDDCGIQPDEAKEVVKAYDKLLGSEKTKKTKAKV